MVSRAGGFHSCSAWAAGHRLSLVVVHALSCSKTRWIFLDQGSNPCPLHQQAGDPLGSGGQLPPGGNHRTTREVLPGLLIALLLSPEPILVSGPFIYLF